MRIAPAAVLLLPLALAAQSVPHRRHHFRRQGTLTESQSGNGNLAESSTGGGGGSGVAVSSDTPTTTPPAVTTTPPAPTTTPPAPTTSAAAPTSAAPTTAAPPTTTSAPNSGVPASNDPSPSSSAAVTTTTTSAAAPTTTAAATPTDPTTIVTGRTTAASSSSPSGTLTLVTPTPVKPTAKPSSSASSEAQEKSSGGLSKGAIIGIVVAASVVGLAAIIWTAIRKWKLRPSKRFDSRMQPIDFSPDNREHGDDFLEKTLHRSASNASADRQRQQFVADLDHDNNLTAGVPEHDFTAGSSHAAGAYPVYDQYGNPHPAHDGYYGNDGYGGYPPDAAVGYPPQPGTAANYNYEYPAQDQQAHGYADVQRGASPPGGVAPGQTWAADPLVSSDFQLNGRPTAGEGPYAQAATYRY